MRQRRHSSFGPGRAPAGFHVSPARSHPAAGHNQSHLGAYVSFLASYALAIIPFVALLDGLYSDPLDVRFLFLAQYALVLTGSLRFARPILFLCSPTVLMITYVNLSIYFGLYAYAINSGLYLATAFGMTPDIRVVPYIAELSFFTLSCVSLAYLITIRSRGRNVLLMSSHMLLPYLSGQRGWRIARGLRMACVLLFVLFVVSYQVAMTEISGAAIFKSISFASYFLVGALLPVALRGVAISRRALLYAVFLFIYFLVSPNNKREAIMLIAIVGIVEVAINGFRFGKLSTLNLIAIVVGPIALVAVVSFLSIMRGDGGYTINSPLDAIAAVPDYMTSDSFFDNIMDNLEAAIFTAMHFKSMSYSLDGFIEPLLGITYVKPLFLPLPQWLIGEKPEFMVAIWTKQLNAAGYSDGAAAPISFIAEAFANFQWGGLILVPLICLWAELVFGKFVKGVSRLDTIVYPLSIFFVINFLLFVRGSGAEIVALNCIAALVLLLGLRVMRLI